jgi:MFS family permease
MLTSLLTAKFGAVKKAITRDTLGNIVLVTNAFVWYYFALDFLMNALKAASPNNSTTILIWTLHFGGIIISAIIGSLIIDRLKHRNRFLIAWMILGVLVSIAAITINITSISNILVLAPLLGVSLGIGMPCCMGYFTESIEIENRGRIGGIILLLSFVGIVALGATSSGDIGIQKLLLLSWRLLGLVLFVLLVPMKKAIEKATAPAYKSLLTQRSFILYVIPWIMFSLITYLTIPIQSDIVGQSTVNSLTVIEDGLVAVFAIIGGFLSDRYGRKRVSIMGFALLGLGYSALGINPNSIFSMYFYTVVDGIAWGMLYVVFVVALWGDLSNGLASDKYYAVGVLPFFASKFLQLVIGNGIAKLIPSYAIFSFTAFFLFLAVLPLVYAPETLPEKTMKDRDLKSYVEKAQKVAQKETVKNQKQEKKNPQKESDESNDENSEEYIEAKKLAEKYY